MFTTDVLTERYTVTHGKLETQVENHCFITCSSRIFTGLWTTPTANCEKEKLSVGLQGQNVIPVINLLKTVLASAAHTLKLEHFSKKICF